ncbi:Lactoylglutathione lyase [Coemansia aciculifera]|uniref:Lactoylglutathione lyase n=2 Tax=Coemansia TaxID=4863 RepID=A0A9W8GNJ5_9FUNG|nr:Lactoylglutathione lyase [Coemansia pectinata]KAJ2861371.1 Lactoylglutathione lyase [Coemansia aciculifera]KAJ2871393.1 Lactoylglutathione lyase [Coemansia aciculifera]KAJ2880513.1 Lactoylglutathione lyase [Coemansia aciculifera]
MTTDLSTYRYNHTMYRIKDPKASIKFYTEVLGMTFLEEHHKKEAKFSLYFLGYADPGSKGLVRLARQGVLELTHNHGTEDDASFAYNTGNGDVGGYGHIAITVDDLQAACSRFDTLGVKFIKRPEEGSMKHIAFIADPDGYRIEILENPMLKQ